MDGLTIGKSDFMRGAVFKSRDKTAAEFLKKRFEQHQMNLQDIRNMKNEKKKLMAVSQEMESVMLEMMFKNMKKTVKKTGMLHGGQAEKIFDDMLTEEYSKVTARSQSLGLAKLIYEQNIKFV